LNFSAGRKALLLINNYAALRNILTAHPQYHSAITALVNSRNKQSCVAKTYLSVAAILFFAAGSAHAIDCNDAAKLTAAEKIICQSDALVARDKVLNTLFQRLAQKPLVMPEMMRKRQRDWLGERDECADVACIERLYERRIRHLQLIEGRYDRQTKNSRPVKFGTPGVLFAQGEWQIMEFVSRGAKNMIKPILVGERERVWQSDLGQPLPPISASVSFTFDANGAHICSFLIAGKKEDCALLGSTRILIGNRIAYDEMKTFITLPRIYESDFKDLPASEVGTFFVNRKPWFSAIPVHDRTLYVPARACEAAQPKRCLEGYQVWRAISDDANAGGMP
jgi:uncharacterized protein YecT (DUF1311 family)